MKQVFHYIPMFFRIHRKAVNVALTASGVMSVYFNGKMQLHRIANQKLPVDTIHLSGVAKKDTHEIFKISKMIEASILGKGAQKPLLIIWLVLFVIFLGIAILAFYKRDLKREMQQLIVKREQQKRDDFIRRGGWQ